MRYNFLSDFMKTGAFGDHRNVAVHFAVNFNAFYYFAAIGFQSAIHIVQLYPAEPAGCRIVEFRR
jgi:hypothetical protein